MALPPFHRRVARRPRAVGLLGLPVVGFLGLGCGAASPTGAEAYCDRFCEWQRGCGLPGGGCEQACRADAHLARVRAPVLEEMGDCLRLGSCEPGGLSRCFVQAAAPLSTDESCRRYCERSALAGFECGEQQGVVACARSGVCGYAAEVLAEAERCDEQPECSGRAGCRAAVLRWP